jgi:hypothetical protein
MMTDAFLQFSTAQAVTATAVSTNTVDLSVARDVGPGESMYAVFHVDVAALAAGAATVTFQVISSANSDLSSPNVLAQTDALAKTELTLGRKPINVGIPPSVLNALPVGQRYLGVRYVVATGPLTAGSFSAMLSNAAVSSSVAHYPSGYTVF